MLGDHPQRGLATFPPGLLLMAAGVARLGITLIKRAPRLEP
ncbi:hypothetical protein OH807_07155 [Kitasatospora sp. NBC_01560]